MIHKKDEKFYKKVLTDLRESPIPFLVGGSYAFMSYMEMQRPTKDLDILCKPSDIKPLLKFFGKRGYTTEFTYPHWLAKVYDKNFYVDIIFRNGNGKLDVTDEWLVHATPAKILDIDVQLVSLEDLIAQKMYVTSRDCFHGHDIYKLLHKYGSTLNWKRILQLMDEDWQVLYPHLILYSFIFPNDFKNVPQWLMQELHTREGLCIKSPKRSKETFRGNLLSLIDYASPRQLKALHNHPIKNSK